MSFVTYLVDDDPSVLKALTRLMKGAGYESRSYLSPREFLQDHDPQLPGCAILDLTMPGVDGLEVQRQLGEHGARRPIIFLTGRGDVHSSVEAMKAGAVDFLTKPIRRSELLAAVAKAEEEDAKIRAACSVRAASEQLLAKLTPREREVLSYVIIGRLNKQIAATLGTVEKTIKVHRGRIMAKLGFRSVAELVRFTERAGVDLAVGQGVGRKDHSTEPTQLRQ